ncbi:hypothetical protein [Streptomyces sp. bgisy034]|uniref:hypothetical protein n=1 Tax=Streptomyces sp. bgisy034 TaxID=3413774 RepID=UPI003EBCBAB0
MQISTEVAELLRSGLSNAAVARETGLHPVKVADVRQALDLPDYYAMLPSYVAPPSHREHGTRAKYNAEGCRCRPCRKVNRESENERTRLLAYGRWQPYVNAEPVRAHIAYLRDCGMGLRAIAVASGVDRRRLQSIVIGRAHLGRGPQAQVRPALAAAILAVEPTLDTLGTNTVIPGVGTTRRLQALVAVGWPQLHLGEELGWTSQNFSVLIIATTVTVRTARAVYALYDRLWNVDPLSHGASPGSITRAKKRAAEARWAPPAAWDDDRIDDPAACPDWTGRCGTAEGYRAHINHHIPICPPCREAGAVQRAERTARSQARALRAQTTNV